MKREKYWVFFYQNPAITASGPTKQARKWTAHLFDFLILFVAFTPGFFADNLRDSNKEQQVAKELLADMVEDLLADTAHLQQVITDRRQKKATKGMLFELVAADKSVSGDSSLHQLTSFVNYAPHCRPHKGTFEQLINAGYLCYFDKDIAPAMTNYYLDLFQRSRGF